VSNLPGSAADILSDEAAEEGRRLAERLCSACHDIEPGGNTPRAGPPLAELARQPGYSVQWFRGWLAKPHIGTPIKSVSENDINYLAAYYETLAMPRAGPASGFGPLDFGGSDEGTDETEGYDIEPGASKQDEIGPGEFGSDEGAGNDFGDLDVDLPPEDAEGALDAWPPSRPNRR